MYSSGMRACFDDDEATLMSVAVLAGLLLLSSSIDAWAVDRKGGVKYKSKMAVEPSVNPTATGKKNPLSAACDEAPDGFGSTVRAVGILDGGRAMLRRQMFPGNLYTRI